MLTALVVGLALIGAALMAALIMRWYGRKARRALEEIAGVTGGWIEIRGWGLTAVVTGRWDGMPFRCALTPESPEAPATLRITLLVPQAHGFRVRPRNAIHGLARRLGLTRPVSTGDPTFDKAFAVKTKAPETTGRALADDGWRHRIAALFSDGVTEVRFDGAGVSVIRTLSATDAISPEDLSIWMGRLQSISRPAAGPAAPQFDNRRGFR
jgi:hypothetical protein